MVAFTLDKDVLLFGVACVDSVHIFDYSEDLSHVTKIDKAQVWKVLFVEYILVMA